MKTKRMTGKFLNEKWNVNVSQALYREDGKWYHHLKHFPGALFDKKGFIVFQTEQDYNSCNYLDHKTELHCPLGISCIPGYVRVIK